MTERWLFKLDPDGSVTLRARLEQLDENGNVTAMGDAFDCVHAGEEFAGLTFEELAKRGAGAVIFDHVGRTRIEEPGDA